MASEPQLHWPDGLTLSGTGKWVSAGGNEVTDEKQLARLRALAIPPAWTHVWADTNPKARIQARGIDARGRVQYVYSPEATRQAAKDKFAHMLHYAEQLPTLRAEVTRQLNRRPADPDFEQLTALVVRFLDLGLFRVGSDRYVQQNHTYGLTTLRPEHVDVTGKRVTFDFVGKEHIRQRHEVTDGAAARITKRLLTSHEQSPREFLFSTAGEDRRRVSSATVNSYIHARSGAHSSAKVARTWGGTVIAAAVMGGADFSAGKQHRNPDLVAFEAAAHVLGNTPTMARNSYVHPLAVHAGTSKRVRTAVADAADRRGNLGVENIFPDEELQAAVWRELDSAESASQ